MDISENKLVSSVKNKAFGNVSSCVRDYDQPSNASSPLWICAQNGDSDQHSYVQSDQSHPFRPGYLGLLAIQRTHSKNSYERAAEFADQSFAGRTCLKVHFHTSWFILAFH